MTTRTAYRWINFPIMDHFFSHFQLLLLTIRHPVEVKNFIHWTNKRFGVAVAIQAKFHTVGFGMVNSFHLVHLTMTLEATNATIDMNGMIEEHIVRSLVNTYPGDWFTR